MSLFIPQVPIGRHNAKLPTLCILNDYSDLEGLRVGKPMPNAQLSVLESCLHMGAMTKHEFPIINLFPDRAKPDGVWVWHTKTYKRYFTELGKQYVQNILETIERDKPKVVVSLGVIATQALLDRTDGSDIRGYPFPLGDTIVVPALHPRDMIWGNYIWRFYLSKDLLKARDYAEGKRKIVNPNLKITDTFYVAEAVLKEIKESKRPVSVDIEVSNFEVSCIGFSNKLDTAWSVPIDERWTEEQEVRIWLMIADILEDETIPKVMQNGIFDVYFLIYKNGIFTKGFIDDTMMAHSVTYPDFLKGLGFLGSVYTDYTYWKDEMDYKVIKKEA